MSNTGKALTNVAFRAKMLELIDKLKNQDKTALVRHVDDYEALNKDTFEAGMNAVIDAIPEGGGGGGGTGEGGYSVAFEVEVEDGSDSGDLSLSVTSNKTISDIINHSTEQISAYLHFNIPIDDGVAADAYVTAKTVSFINLDGELINGVNFYFDMSSTMSSLTGQPVLESQLVTNILGIIDNENDSWSGSLAFLIDEETSEFYAGWPLNIAMTGDSSKRMWIVGNGITNAFQDLYTFSQNNKGFDQWYSGYSSSGQSDNGGGAYISPYAKVKIGQYSSGSYEWYERFRIFNLVDFSFDLKHQTGNSNYIILDSPSIFYDSNNSKWITGGELGDTYMHGHLVIKIEVNNNYYPIAITVFMIEDSTGEATSVLSYNYRDGTPFDN